MTDNTIKPGSVVRRNGHLRIETVYSLTRASNVSALYGIDEYVFKREIPEYSTVSECIVGRGKWYRSIFKFFCTPSHVYYVDGNCGVWETDINHIGDVVFDPVCREKGRVVNFRKMEKAEWLFL
jgi:hypothetical protein